MKNGVLGLEPNNNTEITTTTATSTTKQHHQQPSNNNKDVMRKQSNTNPKSNTSLSQSKTFSTVHSKPNNGHPITKRHQPSSFQSDAAKTTQLGSFNKETTSQNKTSFKDKTDFKKNTTQSNQSNSKAAMPLKETTTQSKVNGHPVMTPKLNRFQIAAAAAATSSSPSTPILDCEGNEEPTYVCLLYTSPSPRDGLLSRMPSSA